MRRLAEKAATDAALADRAVQSRGQRDLSWFGAAITKTLPDEDSELKVLAGAVMSLHESMTSRTTRR